MIKQLSKFDVVDFKIRFRELLKISMPMVLEQTAMAVMGLAITAMVSRIGQHATSAVGMVDSITNLIIAFFAALTTGGTIVVAQFIGARELLKAKRAASQAILLSFVFSLIIFIVVTLFRRVIIAVLFRDAEPIVLETANEFILIVSISYPILAVMQTIFGVLRGTGDTGTPMIVSIIMNVVNFILGFTLIGGVNFWIFEIPSFGVRGAAIALVTARTIGLLSSAYVIAFRSKTIRLNRWELFRPNFSMQKTILNIGLPTSVESCLFQAGRLITQIFIVSMGTAAIASNVIAGSVFGFINVPGNAFATGVMILVGQRIGQGRKEDVKKTINFAVAVGTFFLFVISVVCLVFNDKIIMAYKPTPEAYSYLKQLFYSGLIITPILWGYSFIAPAALRATGDVKFTMWIAITSMFTVRIGLGYVLGVSLGFGVIGVWIGMYADWIIRATSFGLRVVSGKWDKKSVVATD